MSNELLWSVDPPIKSCFLGKMKSKQPNTFSIRIFLCRFQIYKGLFDSFLMSNICYINFPCVCILLLGGEYLESVLLPGCLQVWTVRERRGGWQWFANNQGHHTYIDRTHIYFYHMGPRHEIPSYFLLLMKQWLCKIYIVLLYPPTSILPKTNPE